ncbi:MAG: hypothetical protein P1U36_02565 [Legionellaceae bacterium]|nr:hypothetical protein [Legionellaceae bacterium]
MNDDTRDTSNIYYSKDYNQLLSDVMKELPGDFSALASPTLSKQETVTSLYQSIRNGIVDNRLAPRFPWRRLFEFVPRVSLMFIRLLYASLRFRVRHFPKDAVVFRTCLVPRCFGSSTLKDDYFRQLPDELAEHENVVISFTGTDIALLKRFARIQKHDNQIISYGLLSLLDVIRLFGNYLFTALVKSKKKYTLDGVDVTKYINQSLLLDYLGLRSFEAYVEKYKCRKLIKYKIKAFVYVFENQSWEKSCCAMLREHGIRLIGYQSSGFSPVFLNFFPTEDDVKQHPMPDVVLTVGDYFRKYLLEHGHYSIPVQTFAALRFSYPIQNNQFVVVMPNTQLLSRVLYAFPVHLNQYKGIVSDLISVFQNSDIIVELKLHPLYELNDIKDIPRLPNNFKVASNIDMNSLRETYDCVLFNDNSFGIEALLKGVKSYQYNRGESISDDRFMYFNSWQVTYQLVDLYRLKDLIQSGQYDKKFDLDVVTDYINAMYRSYTPKSLNQFQNVLSVCLS